MLRTYGDPGRDLLLRVGVLCSPEAMQVQGDPGLLQQG